MDVSHELGALRFVVDSPLSSKVAMFNQQVDQHKQSQLLNPFSHTDGRASPKPTFSKDEYGKPLAGSLTEMRGQKANIHVLKEMLELCQIIDSEGYNVKDEPTMRVIPFGELFNIYNYISDKVVGILLRARKHKLVEFEGEMLFQRRDDDVPIFLIKPIHEIRRETEDKIESIKRCGSPAPQATSVLLDKKAHGLDVPKGATPRSSKSRTPSPQTSKSGTPLRDTKAKSAAPEENSASTKIDKSNDTAEAAKTEIIENKQMETNKSGEELQTPKQSLIEQVKEETKPNDTENVSSEQQPLIQDIQTNSNADPTPAPDTKINEQVQSITVETSATTNEIKTDANNNSKNVNNDLPSIVIEANGTQERPVETQEASEANNSLPTPQSDNANSTLLSEPSASG